MVKFVVGNKDGDDNPKLLGIGITDKNIEYLKLGRPIKFSFKEVLVPEELLKAFTKQDEIMIFYGETEETILNEFKKRPNWMKDAVFTDARN